jgi:hypothetical protein
MPLEAFIEKIKTEPETVSFEETIAAIEEHYDFSETAFSNGSMHNESGQNNGSCRIFAFATLHQLTPQQTLHCFGDYYRNDVLQNPHGDDHQNIRNFMQHGWQGVSFNADALVPK